MTAPNKSIQELLRKYWAGESTLEEEQTLIQHFGDDDFPMEDDTADAIYFQFLQEARQMSTSRDYTKHLEQSPRPTARRISLWSRAAAIAAVFIGVVWATFHFQHKAAQDTYEDPMAAWETTKAALAVISIKMQEGTESMESIQELDKLQIIREN